MWCHFCANIHNMIFFELFVCILSHGWYVLTKIPLLWINCRLLKVTELKVTEWPPIGKIAAHSANEMFSWYKYLIVSLVFSHLGFWSGSLFLIAPFPDLCLLVLFYIRVLVVVPCGGPKKSPRTSI